MDDFEDDGKKEKREFKVRVLDTSDRRKLTLSELQGLDVLTTPAWVFDQKRREVPWANVEAMKAYFKRRSFDKDCRPPRGYDCDVDREHIRRSIDEDLPSPQSDTVKFYAMVEDEGCTVHIVGPRRVLLAGIRPSVRRSPSVIANEDEIVTLVVSPIEILEGQDVPRRASLFHEIALSELKFDHTLDIGPSDTPLDVIVKMLDEISAGFPVPSVHAKLVRDMLREGADVHQPIIFAKSFVMTADGLSRRKNIMDMMGIEDAPPTGAVGLLEDAYDRKTTAAISDEAHESPAGDIEVSYDGISDDDIKTWSFDCFAIEKRVPHVLVSLVMKLFDMCDIINTLGIDRVKLSRFAQKIEAGYLAENPYHNAIHAASVLQSTYMILVRARVVDHISTGERQRAMALLIAFIAAIMHDYKHAGVTNKFLIDAASPTAIVYNDTSPLENMHAASAFKLLLDDRYNFLKSFDKQDARHFRNHVISMVLHTDMQHHFPLITRFKTRLSTKWDQEDTTLVLQMVLKAADLSHLTYDFSIHTEWVERLQEEMFRQGDTEVSMGLPVSALCDRTKPGITSSQTDFIDFVAVGLYKALSHAFPTTRQMYKKLIENQGIWSMIQETGKR